MSAVLSNARITVGGVRVRESRRSRAMAAADAFLAQPPHPYSLLAERASGVCLLARVVAGSEHAPPGVRASSR